MKAERFNIKACCGRKAVIYRVDRPLSKDTIASFVKIGFNESAHFTSSGILYVDNLDFILTGPLGSDRLQVKCKKPNCDQNLNDFEQLLQQLE